MAGGGGPGIGIEMALYAIPVVAVVLVLVHGYLGVVSAGHAMRLSAVERKWKNLEPQKNQIALLKHAGVSEEIKLLREKISRSIGVSEKFNRLNALVPDGIWFNEAFLSRTELTLKCSAVSAFSGDEMGLINDLMSNLKKDASFMKGVVSIDSGAATRRQSGSTEVVDFILTVVLSPETVID